MIYNKKQFAQLVDEAVCSIAIKRGGGTKFAATEGELAGVLDCSVSAIQKYRQGASMPSDPEQMTERLVRHCVKYWALDQRWAESLLTQVRHPHRRQLLTELFPTTSPNIRIFISYQVNADPDQQLATYLYNFLEGQGYDVFPDRDKHINEARFEEIDQHLKTSNLLIVLLSERSVNSELTQELIRQAYAYQQSQQQPKILPVFVAYAGSLPPTLEPFLNERSDLVWRNVADNEIIAQTILATCKEHLRQQTPLQTQPPAEASEDGDLITNDQSFVQPRPQFNPHFLDELEAPGGAVKLRDQLYIEREADIHLKREVIRPGTTITIRAPRQTGKSSLLVRGLYYARKNRGQVVNLDIQSISSSYLMSLDHFLRSLAEFIVLKLRLNQEEVEKIWSSSLGPHVKLTYLLEDYILPENDAPIILALDEADRLLQTDFHQDFFSLIRSWHNQRAYEEIWDQLNIILVISTEPYLLIPDISQSPFNVGLKLNLDDFNTDQVQVLNQRHGAPITEADVAKLMALLNGHPYLTRQAFYTLIMEDLTLARLINIADDDLGPFGDHLRHNYWLLQHEQGLREPLKEVIRHNRCADEEAFFRLLRAGLVKGNSKTCTCRCDLYRLYFKDKL